jgi:hypothetical protein
LNQKDQIIKSNPEMIKLRQKLVDLEKQCDILQSQINNPFVEAALNINN